MPAQEKILTPKEQAICEQLTAAAAPHGPRAVALLALDQGLSQAEASERSGLSLGQIRYCLRRFRQVRLDLFPDELLRTGQAEPAVATATAAVVEDGTAADPAGGEGPTEAEVDEVGVETQEMETQEIEATVEYEPAKEVKKSKKTKKKKKVKLGKGVKEGKTDKKSKKAKKAKKKKKKVKKDKKKQSKKAKK